MLLATPARLQKAPQRGVSVVLLSGQRLLAAQERCESAYHEE
jgi:hypothetical protein